MMVIFPSLKLKSTELIKKINNDCGWKIILYLSLFIKEIKASFEMKIGFESMGYSDNLNLNYMSLLFYTRGKCNIYENV